MSYATLTAQSRDPDLSDRVVAAGVQEAHEGTNQDTAFAAEVRASAMRATDLVWPVCLATEDEYASALAAGVERPGLDEAVITDQAILSAVQANWPPDQ